MSKVNNNMFSISEVKRKFYDVKTDSTTTKDYNNNYIVANDLCKYDLPNNNIYTLEGELFKEADDVSNNTSFLLHLKYAKILDVEPFLNYQFSGTPDKKGFLDYAEYGIASDKLISEGKGKLICEWVKTQREILKTSLLVSTENKTLPLVLTESWKGLIKSELHDRLSIVESKIESKISNWKQSENKIECAAFCQLMYDNKWFIKGSTNRKTVNQFALNKYGIDISIQLISKFNVDREKHKILLKRHFK